jgi:hypothetical protein
MATASEKIAALKAEFDAAFDRVNTRLANEATTAADLATIDDMTTRAKSLAADTGTTPAPPAEPMPPVPPTP